MGEQLSFEEALEYVDAASRFGIHPSLDGIRSLTHRLARPQDAYHVVQVGGTNGKTSVTRMTAAILQSQGIKCGHFTSPTLGGRVDQTVVEGRELDQAQYAQAVTAIAQVAQDEGLEPTEFEISTAVALWALRAANVEWAVLEVGMGGRWDATSIATADVAVVTGVDMDHAEHLGATREAIAVEKAQIIVPGSRAVLGTGVRGVLEVFLSRAQEVDAPVTLVCEAPVAGDAVFEVVRFPEGPLGETELVVRTARGDYDGLVVRAPAFQAGNVAISIAAAEAALGRRLALDAARQALVALEFPGRFEVLASDPYVVADGAHNPAAARVLAAAVESAFGDERPWIVLGVLSDKDAYGIVAALVPVAAGFIATASRSDRAIRPDEVARVVEAVTGVSPRVAPSVAEAVRMARSKGPVVATGSLTVAGEARRAFAAS